ncbi:MAG TPA: tetratricopeptide repeat protein [Gemmatimonadales bacterium]|nr:tetratricopeptide repeat protein [Gemmatimonadales bacterium]
MAVPNARLRDIDAADRAHLLKVAVFFGPPCFVMLSMLWYFMHKQGWISGWVELVLTIFNIPVTIGAIFALHRAVAAASVGFVNTVFAVGDIAPPRTYPRQDVLIAQGKYEEAAEWFRDHLRIEPEDHEARLRLAHLLEAHLHGHDEAERLYLEIRTAEPTAGKNLQIRAANGLIDLYRKVGKIERLKVELARFAYQHRGTPLADGAARELNELKQSGSTSESRRFPR